MLTSRPTKSPARLSLVLLIGVAAVIAAASAGGLRAGVLAAVAVACAAALLIRRDGTATGATSTAAAFDAALLGLPGALVVYFSFNSGGYFPDPPAVVAILMVLVLLLRLALVDAHFAAFSTPLAVAAGALGLLTVWILLSASWSDATAR